MRFADSTWVEPPAERTYQWNPLLYRTLVFGQLPVAVDLLMLRFLGEDASYAHVTPGTHPPGYYDLDLATELDPAFKDLYHAGGTVLAVIRNDGPGAAHLLEKGVGYVNSSLPNMSEEFHSRFWPSEWSIYFDLAYVDLFETHQIKRAGEVLKEMSRFKGAPEYLATLTKRFDQPDGTYLVAMHLAKNQTLDRMPADARAAIEQRKRNLEVQYYLYKLRKAQASDSQFRLPPNDPWGGKVSKSADGKLTTTTPYEFLKGME